MTREEYEYLKTFDTNFTTAVKSDYSRNLMRKDLEKMQEIYNRLTHKKESYNFTCSVCQLNFLKRLGKYYFEKKEEIAKKEKSC